MVSLQCNVQGTWASRLSTVIAQRKEQQLSAKWLGFAIPLMLFKPAHALVFTVTFAVPTPWLMGESINVYLGGASPRRLGARHGRELDGASYEAIMALMPRSLDSRQEAQRVTK